MESFQGRMSGELLVGASTIPGEYVLPALIGRFKEKYPGHLDHPADRRQPGGRSIGWRRDAPSSGVVGARLGHPRHRVQRADARRRGRGGPRDPRMARPQADHAGGSARRAAAASASGGRAPGPRWRRRSPRPGTDLVRVPHRGRDGLDPGDQAGGQGRRRRLGGVAARGRRGVPERARSRACVSRTSRSPARSTSPRTGSAVARPSPRRSGPSSRAEVA